MSSSGRAPAGDGGGGSAGDCQGRRPLSGQSEESYRHKETHDEEPYNA